MSIADSHSVDTSKRLEGWKEIADFLAVGVRTARNWERDHGLPIHRFTDSDKARVWTTAHELRTWSSRPVADAVDPKTGDGRQMLIGAAPTAPSETETDVGLRPVPASAHRVWLSIASITLLLIGIGASAKLLINPGPPTGIRVTQNTLIAVAANGQEVWRHTFPTPLRESAYREPFPSCPWIVADLLGEGRKDTLFLECPAAVSGSERALAFDEIGRRLWQFRAGKRVIAVHSLAYAPPYFIQQIALAKSPRTKTVEVIVASVHNWSFPSQVAVLDGKTGNLLREYWHHGHLNDLLVTDLDGDGEPEVLVGGVNDTAEYERAELIVFDHRSISGASTLPDGTPQFQAMGPGTENVIVRFPRSLLSKNSEFNRVAALKLAGDHIIVSVAEGISRPDPAIVYELDKRLLPVNVGLSDAALNRYLQMRGADPSLPSPTEFATQLKEQVQVWRRN